MSGSQPKSTFNSDTEVHITYDDQQRINQFARLNAKYEDFKEDIQIKKNDVQNLEDAVNELMLCDDDEQIMYKEGEIFLYKSVSNAQNSLEDYKTELQNMTQNIEKEIVSLKEQIETLKAHLYAKFGSNIHLENDEE
ncbi:prefoldin subunit 4 [Planococcus citri]|uniref:prefoldin subunit 4 n=1 Tax=Planococcus citri TaxID=170843 RepID=UPI0031F9E49D